MIPLAFSNYVPEHSQAAFTTTPDLMQRVQTLVLFLFPPESAIRTVFKLGSHRRLVLL